MKRLTKTLVLAAVISATVTAPFSGAFAGPRHGYYDRPYYGGPGYYGGPRWGGRGYHHRDRYYRHHRRDRRGDAVAAGVIGLAAGALIGGALAQPSQPQRVYQAPPTYYPAPQPYQAYGSFQPWSPEWYEHCSRKYRSFNAQTGTFRGYDGRDHFCK